MPAAMPVAFEKKSFGGVWLLPFSVLLSLSLSLLIITISFDFQLQDGLRLLWRPHPDAAANVIGNAGEIVAGILAIAITVVAIVVELAAGRYTHRVTELFIAEPRNFFAIGFFVVTAVQAIFVGELFDWGSARIVPNVSYAVSMAMLALSLLMLLPYFAFVFEFLNPLRIVESIRRKTAASISATGSVSAKKRRAQRGVEQLADIGLNAMQHQDKGISMASVEALRELIEDYQTLRKDLPLSWYQMDHELEHHPDFMSMSRDVLGAVSQRRVWFEMIILRKFQAVYDASLNEVRDLACVVAMNTRRVGEAAITTKNAELIDLIIKFFNTYLRSAINQDDIRSAYNVLHQYRLLAERALEEGMWERAVEIGRYFKYYGLVSSAARLPFVLETAAYDLSALCEKAFNERSLAQPELLAILLQVDKESDGEESQERGLRGVRKAQAKLATFYLLNQREDLAREIFRDMKDENGQRLGSIRDEMLAVQSSEFWEINDRGINFDYLTKERKQVLFEFFEWFKKLPPPSGYRLGSAPPGSEPPKMPSVPVGDLSKNTMGAGLDPGRPSQLPDLPAASYLKDE